MAFRLKAEHRRQAGYLLAIVLGYIFVSLVLSLALGRPVGFMDAVAKFVESVGD